MSTVIYTVADSNMVGQEWLWSFTLARNEDDTLELTALQEFIEADEDDEPQKINPRSGIEDGADFYEAFRAMLDEAGVEIETISLAPIAKRLAKFDAEIAADFRSGAKITEAPFGAEARRRDHLRAIKLMKHLPAIEAYCERLCDERTRGGGGISYPPIRAGVRAFTEEYAAEHGRLPRGPHRWELGNGFLSGEHDFGVSAEGQA